MNTQQRLDLCIMMLSAGSMTPERQVEMAAQLLPVAIEHKQMRVTLDELTREAAEQAVLDERAEAAEKLAAARRLGLEVLPFPVVPVRPAPALVALVESVR